MATLGVGLRRLADGTAALELSGELDLSTADKFRRTVETALRGGVVTRLRLDAARLTFVDSTGVGEIVAARRAAEATNAVVVVINPSPFLLHLLRVSGLADMLVGPSGTAPIERMTASARKASRHGHRLRPGEQR
jgi:anti-anti-sigma factor